MICLQKWQQYFLLLFFSFHVFFYYQRSYRYTRQKRRCLHSFGSMPQTVLVKAQYLILFSFLLTFFVISNAFYTKKQFYPSVVYLTKSNTSLAVSTTLSFISTSINKYFSFRYCMCKHLSLLFFLENLLNEYFLDNCALLRLRLVRKICFNLYWIRLFLFKHLYDRVWFSVTETCLAFTVFREEFSSHFVALFAVLLFLKCFHWLAEDRVDYVSQCSYSFHEKEVKFYVDGTKSCAGCDVSCENYR